VALQNRIDALKGGLKISNTGNNQDFWGISWGRPTAFLLLLLLADVKRITPNLITHISNAFLIAGSLLILPHSQTNYVLAAIFINLSLSFDCADGQLARYRKGSGSELGSFYDKVSDAVGMVLLFSIVGWVVAVQTGDMKFLLFGTLAAAGQITGGYAKWVCMTILHKRKHVETVTDIEVPLWQYPHRILLKVFRFAEPDLLFWVGLGLLTGHLDWALWLIVLTQPPVAAASLIYYATQVAKSDARQKTEA
jgi:phosphatidylglycerophosphate synthase